MKNRVKKSRFDQRQCDLGFEDPHFHSRAYHRFFEGYSEFKKVGQNGKVRIERVYTGIWYTPDLSRGQLILRKCIYLACWIISAVLLIFCATRRIGVNMAWYCVAVQVITIVGLAWAAIGILNYLIAPKRQTVFEWRTSSERLKRGTLVSAIAFILSAVLNSACLFVFADALPTQVLCIGGYLLGAALMVLINRLERNVTYIKTCSQHTAPENSDIIT